MNPNTAAWNRLRYDVYAPFYDLVGRRLDRGRRRSIRRLTLRPGASLVIPACGTGLDFPHLPWGLRIIASDISPAMAGGAKTRARKLGLDADVRVMDAAALDLPDAGFDAALLHLALAVVPDPTATIGEVARVLKPGGRVGVFDKFLPEGARPSFVRRAASTVSNLLFSDLNRQLEPLLRSSGLVLEHQEPVFFGGLFKVAVLRKPAG